MNPGPIEEAGQTARSTIDALKGNPFVLAVLILNVVLFLIIGYLISQERAGARELLGTILKTCGPAAT